MDPIAQNTIDRAQDGEPEALRDLVRGVQNRIYKLAVRMLANPEAAEDATQEILIRIITKLSTFNGDSAFETWTYRVATNYLLTAKKVIARDPGLSFQAFSEDLLNGLVDDTQLPVEDHVMLNELRVRCTMGMLLCLDRDHRAAYVLGEILELEHAEAAQVLDVTPANYRQRLSRARRDVLVFTAQSCGLANASAACNCRRRLPAAMAAGRVGQRPSDALHGAPEFDVVERAAAQTAARLVTAKLQRATGPLRPLKDHAALVLALIEPPPGT